MVLHPKDGKKKWSSHPSRQVPVGVVELCFVFDHEGILAVRKILCEG